MYFPNNFIWGCASASYQIEGAPAEDGKGPSIWDVFSHRPDTMADGSTGDVACDSYHRFEEDLDLMQRLAIPNYRLSISWPRVLPEGRGQVNKAGLAYYDRVIDGCLERGITPWITLYHWDLPQALQEQGGWQARETAEAFADYAAIIARHFRGRVRDFITINEPQIAIGMGHSNGLHAPGLRLAPEDVFLCWHHLLLAHGMASAAIRREVPDCRVGISSTGNIGYISEHPEKTPQQLSDFCFRTAPLPEGMSPEDHGWFNHQWFLDPVCLGRYPRDPDSPWAAAASAVMSDPAGRDDLEIIHHVPDFVGLNLYNGIELDPARDYEPAPQYPGYPRTSLKWPITPPMIYWGCRLIWERYGLPVCVTENGQSCNDRIFRDGRVHDPDRIDFLECYLEELAKAVEDGVPVLGYFHWSFTDNLEWHSGYDDRFGLIYIDYRTQQRIPKDSAYWYSDLIRQQTSGAR